MKEDEQITKMLKELVTIDEKDYLKKEVVTSKFTTHNGIETTWNFKKTITNDIGDSRIIISIEATRADCSPNGRDLKVWEYNVSSLAPSIKIYNEYDDETGKYTNWFIPTAKENYELVNKKYVDDIFVKKINSFKDSITLSENIFTLNEEGEIETIINDDTIKELDNKFVKRKYQTTYVDDDKNYDVDKVFISNSDNHYIDIKNKWVNTNDKTDIRETRLHIVAKNGEILGINTDDGNDKNTHTPVNVVSAGALTTKEYVDNHIAAGGGTGSGIFKDGTLVPEVNWGDKISVDDDIIANKQEFVIKQHYSDADSVTIKIHDQRISATKDDNLNQPIICELNSDLVTKYYMDKADKKLMDRITKLENSLLPIGTIIISLTAPPVGTWENIGELHDGETIIGGASSHGEVKLHNHQWLRAVGLKNINGGGGARIQYGIKTYDKWNNEISYENNSGTGGTSDERWESWTGKTGGDYNRAYGVGVGYGLFVWKRIS